MADTRHEVDAALTRLERDEAVAEANHAALERDIAVGEAATAAHWGAQQAAARADAEEQAIDSEAHAQTNAAALWIVGGVLVVLLLGWLIWYLQHQAPPAPTTTVIDRTTTVPVQSAQPTTIVQTPAPNVAPAAVRQPAIAAPAATGGAGDNGSRSAQPAPIPIIINNNVPANPAPASSTPSSAGADSASQYAPSGNAAPAQPSSIDNGSGTGTSSIDNGNTPGSVTNASGAGTDSNNAPATNAGNGQ